MARISDSDIQQLKDRADILRVFEHYGISARRAGRHYQCCCPIHDEKTPSCVLDAEKNTWHCYGCGKGGDVYSFVREYRNLSFGDAVRETAQIMGYELTEPENIDPKEEERARTRRTYIAINRAAIDWFKQQLESNASAKEYVTSRWSEESIEKFDIGYAPDSFDALYNHLRKQGFSVEALQFSSLFAKSNTEKPYSFFRGRVMMPIYTITNEPIGFCGRLYPAKLNKDGQEEAKYKNTKDNKDEQLYYKSKVFYGINFAAKAIREANNVFLVEGNPDVIHMHEIGVTNVIAACGTALTNDQIAILKKLCMSVTLMYDGDTAGQHAIERNGKELLKAGLAPYAVTIPQGPDGEKQDPDTFFADKEHFDEFVESKRKHWIVWYTEYHKDKYKDPTDIARFMDQVCELLLLMGDAEAEGYIDILAGVLPTKSMWKASLKRAKHQASASIDAKDKYQITDLQDSTLKRYGFIEDGNKYMVMKSTQRFAQVSNFTLKPIFLIASSINAKRIFRMTNEYGEAEDLEISQRDLGSRAAFKTAVGSRGNYHFYGKDEDLDKILAYLYDNTKNCIEVTQMGWQPQPRFWAWSNGIVTVNGQFIPVDEQGTVKFDNKWYYIPACSSTTAEERNSYAFERKFVHAGSDADLYTWSNKYVKTYGTNGIMGLCFVIASLFRDVITKQTRSFPILNAFGQRGTGKTEFILDLMKLLGKDMVPTDSANIHASTKAAISDHLSKMYNGFVLLDEYKNNVDPEKIEILKGAYESRGRMKMDMDRDKRRMQTRVDCAVIVAGQEMATADNALFSRMIYLTFKPITEEQKTNGCYEDLHEYTDGRSITPITNSILAMRELVEEHYPESSKKAREDLTAVTGDSPILARIIESYASILAIMHTLIGRDARQRLPLPFDYSDLVKLFAKYMQKQNESVNDTSEVSDFWHAINTMLGQSKVLLGCDMKVVKNVSKFETDLGEKGSRVRRSWTGSYDIVYLNYATAYSCYAEDKRKRHQDVVSDTTLKDYLRNSDAYMGDWSKRFFLRPDKSNPSSVLGDKSFRALVFDYRKLREEFDIDFDVANVTLENQ